MSSKKSKDEPEEDPYDVLGVEFGSNDAIISKAYKKLALKLHPDRQRSKTPAELEEIAKQFHVVQKARDFLLEPEYQESRRKYDAKRESIQRRRQADAKRQESMSSKRSRQLSELRKAEEDALQQSSKKKRKTKDDNKSNKGRSKAEEELIEKLRKEGSGLREKAAKRKAEEAVASAYQQARNDKQDRKERERLLQSRQIRLKWSRRKMNTSPSEHSLAKLLSRFGTVEEVEMIGDKGNLALITFEFPSSCRPCVEFYKKSDEMRAFFVGKRKEQEEAIEAAAAQQEQEKEEDEMANSRRKQGNRDQETLEDRRLRQAEERERLLREMEAEDAGESTSRKGAEEEIGSIDVTSRCVSVNFPSKFKDLTSMESLVKAEEDILGKILSGDALARLKELHA